MAVKQGKNGKWEASFSIRHPKTRVPKSRRRIGLKSKAHALRVEKELVKDLTRILEQDSSISWSQLLDEFIKFLQGDGGHSIKSSENYRLALRAHTLNQWGELNILKISSMDIRKLIHERVGHKSAWQQKNLYKYIRSAFEYAVESRYLPHNPTPRMKFQVGNKLKSVLTEEQATLLLKKAVDVDSPWEPIWRLALYTGMRNGELYALTWDKVSFETRKILVDSAWCSKAGFKDTKCSHHRKVEISKNLLPYLLELKEKSKESNFVLPRLEKWEKGEQARCLRAFLEVLGLPRVRFHDLRASWATILLTQGVPPVKVMVMAGWKDLKTMQHYIRLSGVGTQGITDGLNF